MTNQRTQLADLIIETRGSKNQADFQKELEKLAGLKIGALGAKYVSLVETGSRKKLSVEFLRALELKTGKPLAELEAMNRRSSVRVERRPMRTIRIASGHTSYAAGLIGAALKGTALVELATCSERREGESSNWQPSPENARWITFREGSLPPVKDEKFLAAVADEGRTFYYSANEALDALDGGWADLAAIPSALVEGRRSYFRLLRLVASDAACMLICSGRLANSLLSEAIKDTGDNQSSQVVKGWQRSSDVPVFDMTTRDLGRHIAELERRRKADKFKSEPSYRIGAEPGTIAGVVLDEAVDFASSLASQVMLNTAEILVPIVSQNAATFSDKSLDAMRRMVRADGEVELDGLLIWEPHASWIIEKLKSSDAKPHALISLSRSADEITHRPRRFEFDLVTTTAKSTEPELLRAVRDLLFRIWDVSEELSIFKPALHHVLVNSLATYLDLGKPGDPATSRRSARVLGSIAYDVGLKLEALPLFESIVD